MNRRSISMGLMRTGLWATFSLGAVFATSCGDDQNGDNDEGGDNDSDEGEDSDTSDGDSATETETSADSDSDNTGTVTETADGTGTGSDTDTTTGTDSGTDTGTDTEARSPNIVVVITDDQPYNMLGAAGNTIIRTPNLDRLASEGVYFTRAYLTIGECSGSRASLWTGKLPHATGILKNGQQISLEQALLPRMLQTADYATGMIGKCHLEGDPYYEDPDGDGVDEPVNPDPFTQLLGFDFRLMFFPDAGSISDFYNFNMVRNGDPEEVREEYVSNKLTDEAIAYIENQDTEEPFFLWVAYNVPHEPLLERNRPPEFHPDRGGTPGYEIDDMPMPPSLADDLSDKPPQLVSSRPHQRFLGLDMPTMRRYQRNSYEMVENFDTNVGRILATLDEQGLAEDTVFVFISDNGQFFGEHEMMYKGSTFYDEQLRTPLIIRYPRLAVQGHQVDTVISSVDFMPTLADLAGIEVPEEVMGESLLPLLRGDLTVPRGSAFMEYEGWRNWVFPMRGVVAGNHKLIHHMAHGSFGDYGFEFYDLSDDPYEMVNLLPPRDDGLSAINDIDPDSEDGRALNRLRREIATWQSRTEDPEELELYFVEIEPDDGAVHVLIDAELPSNLEVDLVPSDCPGFCVARTVRAPGIEMLHDFRIDDLDPNIVWNARVFVMGDNGHGAVREATIDFADTWGTRQSTVRPVEHPPFHR